MTSFIPIVFFVAFCSECMNVLCSYSTEFSFFVHVLQALCLVYTFIIVYIEFQFVLELSKKQ